MKMEVTREQKQDRQNEVLQYIRDVETTSLRLSHSVKYIQERVYNLSICKYMTDPTENDLFTIMAKQVKILTPTPVDQVSERLDFLTNGNEEQEKMYRLFLFKELLWWLTDANNRDSLSWSLDDQYFTILEYCTIEQLTEVVNEFFPPENEGEVLFTAQ